MLCTERYERIVASAALAVALPFWALDTFVRVLRCGATAHGRHNQGSEDGARVEQAILSKVQTKEQTRLAARFIFYYICASTTVVPP